MDSDEEPEFREAVDAVPGGLVDVKCRNMGVTPKQAKSLAEAIGKQDETIQWNLTTAVFDEEAGILARKRGEDADEQEYGEAVSPLPNVQSIRIKLTKNRTAVIGLTTDPKDDATFPNGYGVGLSQDGLSCADGGELPDESMTKWDGDINELNMVIAHGHIEFHVSGKKVTELGAVDRKSMYAKVFIATTELRIFIKEVTTCTAVASVDLNRNKVGDEGAKDLAACVKKKGSKVEKLDLGLNAIRDEGGIALAESLVSMECRIKWLDLSHNVLGDQGVSALAEALKHESCLVDYLDLTDNNFGDVGAMMLADAIEKESCDVTILKLALNKIEAPGIVRIAEALEKNTCKVTILSIEGNRGSKASLKRLGRAFACTPRLDVV